jgi:hypothetical protein
MDAQARYEAFVDDLCATHAHVEAGKMFGMPCFKANGKAAGGFWEGNMVFKLPDETVRERVLAIEGATRFDPMGGRPMKEWVVVPAAHADRWAELAEAAVTPAP